jgi:hypothetical protein
MKFVLFFIITIFLLFIPRILNETIREMVMVRFEDLIKEKHIRELISKVTIKVTSIFGYIGSMLSTLFTALISIEQNIAFPIEYQIGVVVVILLLFSIGLLLFLRRSPKVSVLDDRMPSRVFKIFDVLIIAGNIVLLFYLLLI